MSRDKSIDKALPRLATLKALANHITATRCPISPRTLERWPLRFRIINRKKLADAEHALAFVDRLIDEAPVVVGAPARRRMRLVRSGE